MYKCIYYIYIELKDSRCFERGLGWGRQKLECIKNLNIIFRKRFMKLPQVFILQPIRGIIQSHCPHFVSLWKSAGNIPRCLLIENHFYIKYIFRKQLNATHLSNTNLVFPTSLRIKFHEDIVTLKNFHRYCPLNLNRYYLLFSCNRKRVF